MTALSEPPGKQAHGIFERLLCRHPLKIRRRELGRMLMAKADP